MKIALDDRGERPCRQARLTFPVRTRGCIPIRAAPWEDLDAGEDLIRIVDEPRGRSGAGPRVEFRIRKFDGCEGEIREIGLDDLFDLVTRQPHRDGRITLPDADARPCASPAWQPAIGAAVTVRVARMAGLAPQVRQSGQTRHEGGLLKSGNARLRTVLVEAAWRWVRYDGAAASRYRRLVANTGSGKKAIVAMARRLGVLLWRLSVHGEPYRAVA